MLGLLDFVYTLNLTYLRTPALGWLGVFVSSVFIGCWTMTVMGFSGGSSGVCTCSVGVSWFILRSMLGSSMTGSSSESSVYWNLWWGYCEGWFTFLLAESIPTSVILISPIRLPLPSLKINWFGLFQASPLTRDVTVAGIRVVSQLLMVIFLANLSLINWNTLCSFPLVPRQIVTLVCGTWLFLIFSCSCTWQYYPIWIPICR